MYSTKVVRQSQLTPSDTSRHKVFGISATCLIVTLVCSQFCPTAADIYAGDGRNPYFTSRPNPIQNYGQWGHYPILYQDPNRPIEPINKFDPRYSAVTPDTFNRYKIEDPGDLRCPEAVREGGTLKHPLQLFDN